MKASLFRLLFLALLFTSFGQSHAALAGKRPNIVFFFTDDQVATMQTQEITAAQDRRIDIYNKVKAGG